MFLKRLFLNKIFLSIVVFCTAAFAFGRLYYFLTDDFRLSNIKHPMPYQVAWEIPALQDEEEAALNKILSQKFSYFAKGAQSYVFLSEDGGHVLKLFKFKHLRPSPFFEQLASIGLFENYYSKLTARKEKKLWGVFRAHKLAYDRDRDLSGVVFVQLNVVDNPSRKVTLSDKIGMEHDIDLRDVPFVIQKRGESLRVIMWELLHSGDISSAMDRIGKIFDLYAAEYRRGFYDRDHGVMRNFGFAGDDALHIDVGMLTLDEGIKDKARSKEQALIVAGKMREWVSKYYPQYRTILFDFIDKKISSLFDETP